MKRSISDVLKCCVLSVESMSFFSVMSFREGNSAGGDKHKSGKSSSDLPYYEKKLPLRANNLPLRAKL